MSRNIEGKVIIVTGASSGLGEAAARHLAAEGASVVLAARRNDRIGMLANAITAAGGKAVSLATDVTNHRDMEKLAAMAVESFGKIDVLINNAGVMPLSPIERLKIDEWEQMINVNFKGVLYGIAAVLPYMKKQKAGHVISTASVAAYKVFPASAVYSATKYAVRALSEGLRQELKPYNIRTTIISPGAVKTELLQHISDLDVQTVNQEYVSRVGVSPESFARMVAFAVSQPEDVDVNELVFRPTAQEL